MTTPNDGWTVVTCRRRPPHFLPSPHSPPTRTTALNTRPLTYAQVAQSKPAFPQNTTPTMPMQPTPPKTTSQLTFVKSPHSPTMLPFPPSPHLKEWFGRCFRCTRKGHTVAECRAPRFNPDPTGHYSVTQSRPTALNPTATPFSPAVQYPPAPKRQRAEPTFEEFLAQPEPHQDPPMPHDRPSKASCYLNRDDQYFLTLEKTLRGIVIQPPIELIGKLSLDQAADSVAASAKVTPAQLQLARLPQDRFLALLPPNLDRDEVVSAIPKRVWDEGFRFSSYSPLSDTSISIPFFKLWVDVVGVPPELHQEAHMARAISSFGLYLGSIEPRHHGDCHTWSIFLATDDLTLVPHQLELRVGGMVYTTQIRPRRWIKGQIYQRSDLPPAATSYNPPPPSNGSFSDPIWFEDDDVMPMSLTVLREFFKDVPPSNLPPDLAACLAGDKEAIEANHAAYRAWKEKNTPHRPSPRPAEPRIATPTLATPDPTHPPMPTPSQGATVLPSQATPEGCPTESRGTYPRSDAHAARGSFPRPDPALLLCPNVTTAEDSAANGNLWAPHHLFPEITTASFQNEPPALNVDRTRHKKVPRPTHGPNPNHPRRTTRSKSNVNQSKGTDLITLDAQDFVEIPLQYAEGRELLTLIGAAATPIPADLVNPAPNKTSATEAGLPQNSTLKRKQPTSPPAQQLTNQLGRDPASAPGTNIGPSDRGIGHDDTRAQLPTTAASGGHTQQQAQTEDASTSANNISNYLAQDNDDPYLDTVDYSGDDDLRF